MGYKEKWIEIGRSEGRSQAAKDLKKLGFTTGTGGITDSLLPVALEIYKFGYLTDDFITGA